MSLTPEQRDIAKRISRRYRVPGWDRSDVENECIVVILEQLRGGCDNPAWLFMIARQRITNLARRHQPEQLGDDDTLIADTHATSEPDWLSGYDLTPTECAVLSLRFVDGCADAEIADRLRIAASTVRNARCAAYAKIRDSHSTD